MEPEAQAKQIGEAWERLPKKPNRQVTFHVVDPDGTLAGFTLGAHVPKLADADIDLIHTLWLDPPDGGGGVDLHHKEVVAGAAPRLGEGVKGAGRQEALGGTPRL